MAEPLRTPGRAEHPRIALVVPGLEETGGVPTVALFLHRVLVKSGRFASELISIAQSSRDDCSVRLLDPRTWFRGVRVRHGRWNGEQFRHVGAFLVEFEFQRLRPRRKLTKILRSFDVVQIVAGAPAWALVAQKADRPVGLQVATLVAVERSAMAAQADSRLGQWRRLMTKISTYLEPRALKLMDAVFVENQWMAEHVARFVDPSKVVFAPPGIDTEVFIPAQRSRTEKHLLTVGRLDDPRKNVPLLFQAYRLLLNTMPTAPTLVLAGSTAPPAHAWELARTLRISDRVQFFQNVSRAQLVELYQNAAVYVLSSDEEGLGMVLLEAMACGCPVVSTDCGGPSTLVAQGETGFLVPVRDPEALASKIATVLTDHELRHRLGARARETAVARFSLEATGRRFLEWYDQVLGERVHRSIERN